ncbi:MAG: 2-amino-3,7-dideoxy-D-threo-hept-6-ulosonate synthase [Candidatus Micrarchaeia archaeon]
MSGVSRRLKRILPDGRGVVLAFDHGLEHGPLAYKGIDLSPQRIIGMAGEGGADAVLLHKGMVREKNLRDVALIVKLTGKTSLSPVETQSLVSEVENAVALGADAVAATIYFNVEDEPAMLSQFRGVWSAAREYGLPVIAFAYPRPLPKERRYKEEFVAPAARAVAEVGADIVKTYYTGDGKSWRRVIGGAAAPVLAAGGKMKEKEAEVLGMVREIMSAGGAGIAVGRNVWERADGARLLKKIVAIVHERS